MEDTTDIVTQLQKVKKEFEDEALFKCSSDVNEEDSDEKIKKELFTDEQLTELTKEDSTLHLIDKVKEFVNNNTNLMEAKENNLNPMVLKNIKREIVSDESETDESEISVKKRLSDVTEEDSYKKIKKELSTDEQLTELTKVDSTLHLIDKVKEFVNSNTNLMEEKENNLNPVVLKNIIKERVSDESEIDESEISVKKENELLKSFNEETAFSTYFDITIPLIGKNIFEESMFQEKPLVKHYDLTKEKPLSKRYDLARERNERRFAYMRETGIDDEVMRLIDEEEKMSDSDKKQKVIRDQQSNIKMAIKITKLCENILLELSFDTINEKKIIDYFMEFHDACVTPKCLLYVPHMIHTISFVRGNEVFSNKLRLTANECYDKCHAMFPIPLGYNFETVYTSEAGKFLPDDFEKFEDDSLDYGDLYDDIQLVYDSEFNFDANSNNVDSDDNSPF